MPSSFDSALESKEGLVICPERNPTPRVLFAATIAITVRAFLLPIAQHFRNMGWHVDALANGIENDDRCRQAFDNVWGVDWHRNPLDPRNLKMASRVRALVKQNGYDLVHVHTPVASFVTRYSLDSLRREQGVKVVYTAHGFHFYSGGNAIRNRIFETLERRAANWTDFLIVMNREDLKAAEDKALLPLDRLRFMPGIGIDRSHYSTSSVSRDQLRGIYNELNVTPDTPLLLMLAEFTSRKRHADAIRAFSKVVHPTALLLLAGEGPLLESMQRLVAQLGLRMRVRFLRSRGDVPALMKASRALVLPSSQEGLPRSILEALSMGVPVIGSRIRGTTDLLERNAGLLFDVGDVAGLTRAMQWMIDEPVAANEMGKAGQEQSRQYDLTHILRMHEDIYKEALDVSCLRSHSASSR